MSKNIFPFGMHTLLITLFLFLTSCGGGSGASGKSGASDKNDASDKKALEFTPSTLETSLYYSESRTLEIQAKLQVNIDDEFFVLVGQNEIVREGIIYLAESEKPSIYDVDLPLNVSLAAGNYNGQLEIKLCRDQDCASQYDASPVYLPYNIEVKSLTNITPLTQIDGASGWLDSNNHSIYNPITLDPSQFSPRWLRTIDVNLIDFPNIFSFVTKNNILMFTQVEDDKAKILAINGEDGSTAWSEPLDELSTRAIVKDNTLNLIQNQGKFIGLDVNTGSSVYDHTLEGALIANDSSVLDSDVVYTAGVLSGNALFAFDLSTGERKWRVPDASSYNYTDTSTLCVGDHAFYLYERDTGFAGFDLESGERTLSLADPEAWNSKYGGRTYCSGGILIGWIPDGSFSEDLHIVDIENELELWKHKGELEIEPAVYDEGIIYIESSSPVGNEARMAIRHVDLLTGTSLLEQDFIVPSKWITGMLATNNLIIVSTRSEVVAYDLESYEKVWEFPFGGEFMTVSEHGVMFLASLVLDEIKIYAINLQ